MTDTRKFNLAPYKARRTHYDHFKTFGAAVLLSSPRKLLFLGPLLAQNGEKCTAYTSASIREAMTGKPYDPEMFWADETAIGGTSAQGSNLETAAAVGVNFGFAPVGSNLRGDKASAYLFVNKVSGLDVFDQIKTTITQMNCPLSVGLLWFEDWDNTEQGIVPHTFNKVLGLHNTEVCGFTNSSIPEIGFLNPTGIDYLVIKGSWGEGFGLKGYFFFDRYMANKVFNQGIFYWSDSQIDSVKKMGLISALLQNVVNLLRQMIAQKNGTYPPAYLWDTFANARHSVRVICDEEGLSVLDKNVLCACVQVESNFNPQAFHHNKDKNGNILSTDYGICQVNDYWHIGPGKEFPSTDYVLQNPEQDVRWMCKQWKAGNQHLWMSYTSGLYKRYL